MQAWMVTTTLKPCTSTTRRESISSSTLFHPPAHPAVRAYTPEDAHRINEQLLQMSEALVNQLNERGRKDMIQYAAAEVAEAASRAKITSLSLAQYRNDKGVIDPGNCFIPLQQIAKLQDEVIATKFQILQLEKVAKDNAQLPVLRQRAQLLVGKFKQQRRKWLVGVTGPLPARLQSTNAWRWRKSLRTRCWPVLSSP